MKRVKSESYISMRFKLSKLLFVVAGLYLIFIAFKFPHFLEMVTMLSGDAGFDGKNLGIGENVDLSKPLLSSVKDTFHRKLEDDRTKIRPLIPKKESLGDKKGELRPVEAVQSQYGRITREIMNRRKRMSNMSLLERMAHEAWISGSKAWKELDKFNISKIEEASVNEGQTELCPSWVSMSGEELASGERIMFLPCGLTAGSSVTVVGTPKFSHEEFVPQLTRLRRVDETVMVSQFMVELQGLKAVDGEDPPRILHLNPRLKGDWSHQPVIEHNTCYRMQWGAAQRCDGLPSKNNDDSLVDGLRRCEKWMRDDTLDSKESKSTSWFKRFIGRELKPEVTWPFPFVEGRLFVMTMRAGIEGYHISVGGRHVSSFPYRPGFTLEDATGLAVKGDVNVHSVYATSLPASHPSFSPHKALEMSPEWKASPLPSKPLRLFIGVLSATNHFAERMAVRKTWMQHSDVRSLDVVVRFFVALSQRKEVNAVLKKEAEYFGDVVIVPFMDLYELVVLKTIAICEFGVRNVTTPFIMKCDDDTFVRVDTVLKEIEGISPGRSLYMGNLNLFHRPLRTGKWAVTWEEWPEAIYPPYANGPGYIISIDIAKYIVSQHYERKLRIFKMEDVSMGMWVERFNSSTSVQYSHSWKFCQYGCMENYYTAHYQSPRQMLCLWDKLSRGRASCCNFR